MKKFFTLALTAASLLTLGVVSSCKDYNEDLYNDVNKLVLNERASLVENLKAQGYNLQDMLDRIKALEEKKECACNFDESIKKYFESEEAKNTIDGIVKGLGYAHTSDIIAELDKALAENGKITLTINKAIEDKIKEAINSDNSAFQEAIKNIVTKEYLIATLGDALSNIKGLDEAAVKQLVEQLLEDYCKSSECATMLAEYATKIQALEGAQQNLQDAIDAINTTLASNSDDINLLFKRINSTDSVIVSVKGELSSINLVIEGINEILEGLQADVATHGSEITELWTKIAELEATVKYNNIWNEVWNAIVDERIDNKLEDVSKDISNALKVATEYTDSMISKLKLESNYVTLEEVNNQITAIESELKGAIDELKETVSGIEAQVNEISEKIDKLTGRMDIINDRLNAQITSIIVQGATNPLMFNTTISLPIGIQSNILCAYYGDCISGARYFPATASTGVVAASDDYFTSEELSGVQRISLRNESFTSTAGKLYFTVNPSNCDFSKSLNGKVLYLYDSQNNKSAIKLINVKKSDAVLMHGITRAAENGFYEAEAEIDYEGGMTGNDASINIPFAKLENVGKEAMDVFKTKQGIKKLVADVALLAFEAQQMPAYALGVPYKYKNDHDGEEQTAFVYSNYGIAALALDPLSYNFDPSPYTAKLPKKYLRHIPYLSSLFNKLNKKENQIKEILNFQFHNDKIGITGFESPIAINFTGITVDETISINIDYTYEVPAYDVNGNVIMENGEPVMIVKNGQQEVELLTPDDENGLAAKINKIITAEIEKQLADANAKFDSNMEKVNEQLNEQIHNLLDRTADDINTKSDEVLDIIDGIMGKVENNVAVKWVDKLIGRVNNAIDVAGRVIDNPNFYLQPLLLMHNEGINHVGTTKTFPSCVKFVDGANSIALYLTSYTAETLNPAYKKFIKVTKVTGGSEALCKEAMDYANAQKDINKVIDGTIRSVPFFSSSKYAGLTYEITYAAMDYCGYQSIQRYYIRIAK